jgi:hypothetical protein
MHTDPSHVARSRRIARALLACTALGISLLHGALPASADSAPDVLALPNGFNPEGIAAGNSWDLYVGSLNSGAIYKLDARTGNGTMFTPAGQGRLAVGMSFDKRTGYLFVAGGSTGHAYVYDTRTGETVADLLLTSASSTLVNDVTITPDAAYFTDTFRPVYYRVPLTSRGRLPEPLTIQEIPLSGDFVFGPTPFNSNGIVSSPNGRTLIIVHTDLGRLYRVDALTGVARQIDLGVERVGQDGSDGLVLVGRTLYIINFYDELIPIRLNNDWSSGVIQPSITSATFTRPATAAKVGPWLYVVNAKLDVAPTPDTTYTVSRVRR